MCLLRCYILYTSLRPYTSEDIQWLRQTVEISAETDPILRLGSWMVHSGHDTRAVRANCETGSYEIGHRNLSMNASGLLARNPKSGDHAGVLCG